MKKTLALVVLAGLMLTGCGGKQAAGQPTATATAGAVAADTLTVPDVMGLTLDKATDQLKDLGLKVEAVDTADGKLIILKKNWQVTSQDPTEGAHVAKGSTVHLGVKNIEKAAAEKAAADKAAAEQAAAAKAAAEKVVADKKAAAEKVVADKKAAAEKAVADKKAAADKVAADKAAADQAAAQAAAQQAAQAPAPAAVYYPNCTAARQAGAAPIYSGAPGYGKHLDRDGDGIGCDK